MRVERETNLWDITSIWDFWVAKGRERKMRGSTWGKSCVTCFLMLLVLVLCCRGKKEKRRPLISWGQPSPLLCNQGQLMAESQFKDCNPTTSPHNLLWDLSWSSFASFSLSPRRHNQIQGVIRPSWWRHGQSQRRGPAHKFGHIFCTRRNYPNPRALVGS
jgi:hypothetical protein